LAGKDAGAARALPRRAEDRLARLRESRHILLSGELPRREAVGEDEDEDEDDRD
jgi:hypothetical protein